MNDLDIQHILLETPLPVFDGWDEGSPLHGADLVSKQHNEVFSEWEKTARKEV